LYAYADDDPVSRQALRGSLCNRSCGSAARTRG